MPAEIRNTLNEREYKACIDYLQKEGENMVELSQPYSLDYPFKSLESLQLISPFGADYKTYQIMTFQKKYIRGKRNTTKLCAESLQENDFKCRNKKSEKILYFDSRNGAKYELALDNKGLMEITNQVPRKIIESNIKEDIETLTKATECILNRIYEDEGKDYGYEFYIALAVPAEKEKVKLLQAQVIHRKHQMKQIPNIRFEDIGGCFEAKDELRLLAYSLKNPLSYKNRGLECPRGILLYGPAGTGKTMLAKAMAKESGASLFSVECSGLTSMWYGEAEKNMNNLFDSAKECAPSIVIMDEIDNIAPRRADSHEATRRMVGAMLGRMDGMEDLGDVTIIGTTNFIENIDGALLRPGRFDKVIEIPLPDEKSIKQIYRLQCRGRSVDGKIGYREIAKKSEGLSGADIKGVLQLGLQEDLRREIRGEKSRLLSTEDILDAITQYKRKKEKLQGIAPRIMYH